MQRRPHDLAHSALVHGVGEDLAALCEEDAGRFCGGAVGDGVEVPYWDSQSVPVLDPGVESKSSNKVV